VVVARGGAARDTAAQVFVRVLTTAQQVAVNAGFKQELAAVAAEYKKIVDGDAPAFVELLKRNGVVTEIVP